MARSTLARTENFIRSSAERRVYQALTGLPDRFIVIHSYYWLGEADDRHGEGEADFIVIDPEAGMLVIEVKGGSIACEQGRWLQGRIGDVPAKPIDPYRQASKSLHFLRKRMEDNLGAHDLLFGYLAWFPDTDTSGIPLPPGAPAVLTLDEAHLADPQMAIEGVFSYWRAQYRKKRAPGEKMAQAMWDYLCPTFQGRAASGAGEKPAEPPPPSEPLKPEPIAVAPPPIWRKALERLIGTLMPIAKAVMLMPVRFVMEVIELAADFVAGLLGWCWSGLKTGLLLTFVCGLLIGAVSLVLRFGFHKVGATPFVYGGFVASFLAFAGHELGLRLEKSVAGLTATVRSSWTVYRASFEP